MRPDGYLPPLPPNVSFCRAKGASEQMAGIKYPVSLFPVILPEGTLIAQIHYLWKPIVSTYMRSAACSYVSTYHRNFSALHNTSLFQLSTYHERRQQMRILWEKHLYSLQFEADVIGLQEWYSYAALLKRNQE